MSAKPGGNDPSPSGNLHAMSAHGDSTFQSLQFRLSHIRRMVCSRLYRDTLERHYLSRLISRFEMEAVARTDRSVVAHPLSVLIDVAPGLSICLDDLLAIADPKHNLCEQPGWFTTATVDLLGHIARTKSHDSATTQYVASSQLVHQISRQDLPPQQRLIELESACEENIDLFPDIPSGVTAVHVAYFVEATHIIHGSFQVSEDRKSAKIVIRDSMNNVSQQSNVVREFRLLGRLVFARPKIGLASFDWKSCEVDIQDCPQQTNYYDCGPFTINSIRQSLKAWDPPSSDDSIGTHVRLRALMSISYLIGAAKQPRWKEVGDHAYGPGPLPHDPANQHGNQDDGEGENDEDDDKHGDDDQDDDDDQSNDDSQDDCSEYRQTSYTTSTDSDSGTPSDSESEPQSDDNQDGGSEAAAKPSKTPNTSKTAKNLLVPAWTDRELNILYIAHNKDLTYGQIAAHLLPSRTAKACRQQILRAKPAREVRDQASIHSMVEKVVSKIGAKPPSRGIRKPHPKMRANMWTDEEEETLINARRKKVPYAEIAKTLLPGRSAIACEGRMLDINARSKFPQHLKALLPKVDLHRPRRDH